MEIRVRPNEDYLAAIAQAKAGDTIVLEPGNYPEMIKLPPDGTIDGSKATFHRPHKKV